MKISKIAIAALFAAGLIAAPATAGFATEKPELALDCAEGYVPIYNEDGTASCEVEAVPFTVDEVEPNDSCWTTEDGTNVCARGAIAPMPATSEETPEACSVVTDDQGVESEVCPDMVPYGTTAEEDEGVGYVDDTPIDDTLMLQSGQAKSLATPAEPTVFHAVAIFGVLAGVLWVLVNVIRQRKEAK
jgi:hypothetical protein